MFFMPELPLVLLHGFPLDARMWNDVRAPLAARTRLITPDQRGLGRTPLPETDREPSLDDAARDLIALLDRLELDEVVLGGCSMGGYVSMAVLRAAPERVAGLVLIDTRSNAEPADGVVKRRESAARAEAEGHTGWLFESMLPNLLGPATREGRPDVVEALRELMDSQQPSGVAWAQRAIANRPDSLEILRATDVPALVVVGADDTLTPPEDSHVMAEALPNAKLVELPGAGHLTPMEDPAGVVEAILDWYPR
jgi:pimeloyl-ACP methyl ester carboxylesterase